MGIYESQRKSWLKMEKVSTFFGLLGLMRKKGFLFETFSGKKWLGIESLMEQIEPAVKEKTWRMKVNFFQNWSNFRRTTGLSEP